MFLFTNRCGKISGGVTTPLFNFLQYREGAGTQNLNIEIKENAIDVSVTFEAGDIIKIIKIEPKGHTPSITPDYPEAISLKLIPIRFRNQDGSPIISTLNLNEIDLKKVVPDMTFRDLIMIIKNWKNYEFIP
jgi:hypothetical protein